MPSAYITRPITIALMLGLSSPAWANAAPEDALSSLDNASQGVDIGAFPDTLSGTLHVADPLATPEAPPVVAPDIKPEMHTTTLADKDEGKDKIANEADQVESLLDMSLEELLAQEVTSVAKKSRRVADSAAAVTVITQEDIRRSAARTVPDLLRTVPGMEVAEVQSSSSSVATRGLLSRFSANMLVMIDGAAIYSTSISGMFWDQALIPLQDIERIEVIRGPGGTLWGSNSISGIVNIITKQSVDTQGLRLNASVGTFDARGEFGFGRQLFEDLSFRLYGNYRRNTGLDGPDGALDGNAWQGGLGGVRFDYAPTLDDSIVVLGEYSKGKFSERMINVRIAPTGPTASIEFQDNRFNSSHALVRWKHRVNDDFNFSLQAYYNNLLRSEFGAMIDRDLYDLSFEGRIKANQTHEINFGVAGRLSKDTAENSPALSLPSMTNTDKWLTGFIQDDISLIPDRLRLIVGSKFERNNFTGTEIQPSMRLFYRANSELAAWASVSRGVRTPLLIFREMVANMTLLKEVPGFDDPVAVRTTFTGNPVTETETITSLELGMRGSLAENWSFDIAGYYSQYDDLDSAQIIAQSPIFIPQVPFPVGVQIDQIGSSNSDARSFGAEFLISGMPLDWWKTEFSYSFLNLKITTDSSAIIPTDNGASASHQLRFSSQMNLSDRLSLDTSLHYVGSSDKGDRKAYTDLDIHASYRLSTQLELSIVGSNLLNKRRLEYVNDLLPIESVYVPRSAYVEARVRF